MLTLRSAAAPRATAARCNATHAVMANGTRMGRLGCSVLRAQPAQLRRLCAAAAPSEGPAAATKPEAEAAAPAPAPSPKEAAAAAAAAAERRSELMRGSRIILQELRGLDFSAKEARLYFTLSRTFPRGTPRDFDMQRACNTLAAVLAAQSPDYAGDLSALDDLEALAVVNGKLTDIWGWRRRGGGMNLEEAVPPHQLALADIDNLEKEDIDKVTSSLLDSLPITDAEKQQMSGTVQSATMGAINGAVWGSLVAGLAALLAFNFLRT